MSALKNGLVLATGHSVIEYVTKNSDSPNALIMQNLRNEHWVLAQYSVVPYLMT